MCQPDSKQNIAQYTQNADLPLRLHELHSTEKNLTKHPNNSAKI